ncbi:20690_t:CDS:2 [Gigaspora rosea]|nr:20690_t:CDS:2 [Gigaspora rosea]
MLIAIHFVEQYARQNRFAIYKHKKENFKDGTCRKRLGKQKNKRSKKQECMWQINITRQLNSSIVTVSTFNNEHNYELSARTLKFAVAYKTFSQEIMDQIEFYIVHKKGLDQSDAAALLLKLFELQAHDPVWFVKPLIDDTNPAMIAAASVIFPKSHHMQCLYHLYQNLSKNLRPRLGLLYQEFLKDFTNIQSSHYESVFEQRSQGIAEKYAAGEKYIVTMLLNRKYSWVKCFTSRHFTAGTQSTQRVKSENTIIKKAVQSSFSFLEVQEALKNILNSNLSIINTQFGKYKVDNNSEIPVEADEDRELNLQFLITIVNPDDILKIWKTYNNKKEAQKTEVEKAKQQESLKERQMTTNKNQSLNKKLINYKQVLNPLKHQSKGRQPVKRLKSSNEIRNKTNSKGKNVNRGLATDESCKCGLYEGILIKNAIFFFVMNRSTCMLFQFKELIAKKYINFSQIAKILRGQVNLWNQKRITDLEQPIQNHKEKYLKVLKTQKTNTQVLNSASCIHEETTKRNQRTRKLTKTNQDKKVLCKKDITIQIVNNGSLPLQHTAVLSLVD